MNNFEEQVHRTWVQMLVDQGYKEIAAIAIDTDLLLIHHVDREWDVNGEVIRGWDVLEIEAHLPSALYALIHSDHTIKEVMEDIALQLLRNRTVAVASRENTKGVRFVVGEISFNFLVKLIYVEDDWQNQVRALISGRKVANQATVTELMFAKSQKEVLIYNEMKFGSQAEIRIAQELENRKILFFPLPLAVRADTGEKWKDHREADFLICHKGKWGILEVSFHLPTRYENDKEKDAWFKRSGILCVEHYPAERCHKDPSEVVDEFLSFLVQFSR